MTFAATQPTQSSSPPSVVRRHRVRSPGYRKPEGTPETRQVDHGVPTDAGRIDRPGAPVISFGRFSLLGHRRELLADGVPVPLGNRAIDVLMVLIEARGELVTKDELLSRVWTMMTVEENNLQFQISTLRKALGEDRGYINTVCRRGYRFTADITVGPRASPAGATAADPHTGHTATAHLREPPSNLPAPTSDLIGRETQLSDLAALVAANRLITLVGPGGIGKTRLGIELGRRLLSKFADGVWITELGPLSDPGLAPLAISTALGLSDAVDSPERLAAALSSKRLLLVLDNCEHLIDAAASIVETLLHTSASLKVIATSREPLRAEGESVYRVPPLDVPPNCTDAGQVLQHSAVKLFIARTCAGEPTIHFDARIAAATAKICRRLDGIPLALELAAASAVALGVEALADRLDEGFGLLTAGRRTAPARHQTLRATFDWSHALLNEPERHVLRRLSIFGGAFTMEAATVVAVRGDIAAFDVGALLASLIRKSLVVSDFVGPVPRYRLLETTRAYAIDKLTESGEYESVAKRLIASGSPCIAEADSRNEGVLRSTLRNDRHPRRRARVRDPRST